MNINLFFIFCSAIIFLSSISLGYDNDSTSLNPEDKQTHSIDSVENIQKTIHDRDMSHLEASSWLKNGFTSIHSSEPWKAINCTPAEAKQWIKWGYNPFEVEELKKAGVTIAKIKRISACRFYYATNFGKGGNDGIDHPIDLDAIENYICETKNGINNLIDQRDHYGTIMSSKQLNGIKKGLFVLQQQLSESQTLYNRLTGIRFKTFICQKQEE